MIEHYVGGMDPNPDKRTTSNLKYENLTMDDLEFYERVSEHITASHALPFDVPVDQFFRIVVKCLKFFWEYDINGTEEVSYFLPYHELIKFRKGTGLSIQLPYNIENIFGWHMTNQAYNTQLGNFLRYNLIQTYSTGSISSGITNSGGGNGGFRSGYKSGQSSVSNMIMSMYEFESYNELFGRIPKGSFNNNTGKLNFQSGVDSSLVIDCFERIPPEALYGSLDFEEYVTACVEESLGRISTAFDFQMIGNVKINYDQIRERGIEKKKEIEESIKEASGNHDFIFFKK